MSKNTEHSFWLKTACIIAVCVAFMFVVELVANFRLITLNDSDKGAVTGITYTDGSYVADCSGYFDKVIINYTSDIAAYFSIDVEYINPFGYVTDKSLDDKNSVFMDHSVVKLGENVKKLTITPYLSIPEKDIEAGKEANDYLPVITDISAKCSPSLNGFRMAFTFLFVMLIASLIVFRDFFAKHIEYGFLIIALCAGTFMAFANPVTRVGWDEDTHLKGAYVLNYTGNFQYNQFTQDYIISFFNNNPFEHSTTYEEYRDVLSKVNELSTIKEGDAVYSTGIHHSGYATFSYMFMGLTFTLCKLFKVPLGTSVMLVRFTDLCMYIVLIFLAIKKLPKGKLLMSAIALMPTPLYIAATCSYDTTVTGFMYLGLAYLFAPVLEERTISWKEFLVFLFTVGFACIPKAVYIPVILIGLFAPHKCFTDKKTEKIMKALVIIACVAGLSTFVLPTLISPSDIGDTRAGDTSHARAIQVILAHPVAFTGLFIRRIKETFCDYTLGSSTLDLMAYMGRGTGTFFISIYLVLLTATGENAELVKDGNSERMYGFRPYFKYILWFLILGTVCLIWLAMFMSYTVVGTYFIDGVQGRYYIPFLFPILFSLSFNKVHVAYDRTKYIMSCFIISTAIIFFAVGQLILVNCI